MNKTEKQQIQDLKKTNIINKHNDLNEKEIKDLRINQNSPISNGQTMLNISKKYKTLSKENSEEILKTKKSKRINDDSNDANDIDIITDYSQTKNLINKLNIVENAKYNIINNTKHTLLDANELSKNEIKLSIHDDDDVITNKKELSIINVELPTFNSDNTINKKLETQENNNDSEIIIKNAENSNNCNSEIVSHSLSLSKSIDFDSLKNSITNSPSNIQNIENNNSLEKNKNIEINNLSSGYIDCTNNIGDVDHSVTEDKINNNEEKKASSPNKDKITDEKNNLSQTDSNLLKVKIVQEKPNHLKDNAVPDNSNVLDSIKSEKIYTFNNLFEKEKTKENETNIYAFNDSLILNQHICSDTNEEKLKNEIKEKKNNETNMIKNSINEGHCEDKQLIDEEKKKASGISQKDNQSMIENEIKSSININTINNSKKDNMNKCKLIKSILKTVKEDMNNDYEKKEECFIIERDDNKSYSLSNLTSDNPYIYYSDQDVQNLIYSLTNSLRYIQNQTIDSLFKSDQNIQFIEMSLKSIILYAKQLLYLVSAFKECRKIKKTKHKVNSNPELFLTQNKELNNCHSSIKHRKKGKEEYQLKNSNEIKTLSIKKYKFFKGQINVLLEIMESMINSFFKLIDNF